jgi:hypothetical protein
MSDEPTSLGPCPATPTPTSTLLWRDCYPPPGLSVPFGLDLGPFCQCDDVILLILQFACSGDDGLKSIVKFSNTSKQNKYNLLDTRTYRIIKGIDYTTPYESNSNDIISLINKSPALIKLNVLTFTFNGWFREVTDAAILEIREYPNLTGINLSYCSYITDATIISLFEHLFGMEEVNFTGCTMLTNAAIMAIATNSPKLHTLIISDCCLITDASIDALLANCPNLQCLDLYGCSLITDEAKALVSHINKTETETATRRYIIA